MLAQQVGKEFCESREYHGTVCLSRSSKASERHLPQVASTVETLCSLGMWEENPLLTAWSWAFRFSPQMEQGAERLKAVPPSPLSSFVLPTRPPSNENRAV